MGFGKKNSNESKDDFLGFFDEPKEAAKPNTVDDIMAEFGDIFDAKDSSEDDDKYSNQHQRTEDWYKMRLGRITASTFPDINYVEKKATGTKNSDLIEWIKSRKGGHTMLLDLAAGLGVDDINKLKRNDIYKVYNQLDGDFELTQTAHKLLCRKLGEMITQKKDEKLFKSEYMERGIELEPDMLDAYEKWLYEYDTSLVFEEAKFVENPYSSLLGGSPDGLVRDKNGTIVRVVEGKCPSQAYHVANLLSDKIDKRYIKQCIGHLYNTGAMYLDFVTYHPDFPPHQQLKVISVSRMDIKDEYDAFVSILERYVADYERMINELGVTIPESFS
jgi:hypothetical protein